ncbi:hypothetical protein JCM10207_008513 [Rhodosporidiobolus poonsookiae]
MQDTQDEEALPHLAQLDITDDEPPEQPHEAQTKHDYLSLLPAELLERIFTLVFAADGLQTSLSMPLSKTLQPYRDEQVFRVLGCERVHLYRYTSAMRFVDKLNQNPRLGRLVESVWIRGCDYKHYFRDEYEHDKEPNEQQRLVHNTRVSTDERRILAAFSHLTSLSELDLSACPDICRLLLTSPYTSTTKLRSLTLRMCLEDPHLFSLVADSALCRMARELFIDIYQEVTPVPLPSPPSSPPAVDSFPFLQKLILASTGRLHSAAILFRACTGLKVLYVQSNAHYEDAILLAVQAIPRPERMRRLELHSHSQAKYTEADMAASLYHFCNLQEVSLNGHPFHCDAAAVRVLSTFPLESLVLGWGTDPPFDEVLELVQRSRTLKKLDMHNIVPPQPKPRWLWPDELPRDTTGCVGVRPGWFLPVWYGDWSLAAVDRLYEACQAKGVEFRGRLHEAYSAQEHYNEEVNDVNAYYADLAQRMERGATI